MVRKKKRVHQVKLNFTDEEIAAIESAAKKEMRSVNAFARVATLVAATKVSKARLRGTTSSASLSEAG